MARKRMIDPEFWSDEEIGQLSYFERILFLGCLCNTDDSGKTKAVPSFLKASIFPYDNTTLEEIKEARDKICDLFNSVQLYEEDDGKEYIIFHKFHQHQKLKRATPSKIPDPKYKKVAIPAATRRGVAMRYGLNGIGSISVPCRVCGAMGSIHWMTKSWVHFRDLELDHILPESAGGTGDINNIDLICRSCNRSKGSMHQVSTKLVPSVDYKRREEKLREEKEPKKTLPPTHPSLDDVKNYCKERSNGVDPERWFNFYSAKGWMIGKNPMKDWKAAVRTWERQEAKNEPESRYRKLA